jgi:hypothetical protein
MAHLILDARPGSEAHKALFCRSLLDTHRPWRPERLPWPRLDDAALARLRALPFWGEALGTERETAGKISAYAATVGNGTLREAIALQGFEEERHARLLEVLLEHYEIAVTPRSVAGLPSDRYQAFVDAGYGECVDSFFAFGLFEVARRSGFFPEPLLRLIEPIVDEEARHIVFFANWEAFEQIHRRRHIKAGRAVRSIRYYVRAARRRAGAVRSAGGEGFTAGGAAAVVRGLTAQVFLETCLHENARRLGSFDPRLLRPRLVPALARVALRGLRGLWRQS